MRIRGGIEGSVFFCSVTGGHWGAVGKVGVPVLWGLGGCSGAGVDFQSVVRYLTHAAESKPTNRTGFCPVLPFFTAILVHFCFVEGQVSRFNVQPWGTPAVLRTLGAPPFAIVAKEEAHGAV